MLVLDDATSAVDTATEAAIHETLRGRHRERTTLLVAHRRSTLALADRIAVLDGGRVVDVGTHAELDGALRAVPRAARRARGAPSTSRGRAPAAAAEPAGPGPTAGTSVTTGAAGPTAAAPTGPARRRPSGVGGPVGAGRRR